jgi:outer membrane protein assembly factor BamB
MLKKHQAFTGATAFGIAVLVAMAHAQVGRGGSAWLTARGDAQRTSWIRADALISVQAMSKPGFELQWKSTLENTNRRNYGLGGGVSAPGVTLFVPMSLVTASSNNVYAIDSDTGYLVWQRHFDATLPAATDACPGGTLSGPTRIVSVAPPAVTAAAPPGGGGRAAQGYRSVLGQPGEGAPVEVRGGGAGRAGAPPAGGRGAGAPPNAAGGAPPAGQRAGAQAPGRGQGGGFGRGGGEPPVPGAPADQFAGGGFGRPSGVVYVMSSDGVLHVMGLMTGKDLQRPAPFVPANSRWSDPIAVGTMLYTSTSGGCGGAPDAVWAIDLESESKPVVSWKSDASIVGSLAFTTDGTLVAVTVSKIVTLDAKTLQVKGTFSAPGAEFSTGPTVLRNGEREFVGAATRNGHIFLADAAALGQGSPKTGFVDSTFTFGPGSSVATDALATWQEMTATAGSGTTPASVTSGTRWILVPTADAVAALRLDEARGAPVMDPRWTAEHLAAPVTPIIVNGVVFALEQGRTGQVAVLHAFEGTTGKELWSSGKTMTAAAAPGSFWTAFGQVYVGTMDGTLYAFGFNDERR